MSPQINSQGPLSDLPGLHVADGSNMSAEMERPGVNQKLSSKWLLIKFKTLSYHFDFYVGEKYSQCLLRDFSDYNRRSIGRGNPIISDDRLWNLNRFPPLLPVELSGQLVGGGQ